MNVLHANQQIEITILVLLILCVHWFCAVVTNRIDKMIGENMYYVNEKYTSIWNVKPSCQVETFNKIKPIMWTELSEKKKKKTRVQWNGASHYQQPYTYLYLHTGTNIPRIKQNHTIKMKESTHNQIMISFALYFTTISSSFLYINRNKTQTQWDGRDITMEWERSNSSSSSAYTFTKNQIYIATIFHRFALFIRFFLYWLLFDFKGESINRHKLTNISEIYAWCTMSFVHDNISMSN